MRIWVRVMVYFDDFEEDAIIAAVGDILDALDGGDDDTDEGGDCMTKGFILDAEDFEQKIKILIVGDFEDIPSYEFLHKAFAELGGNL